MYVVVCNLVLLEIKEEISLGKMNIARIDEFWALNASWIFPLIITIVFSVLGVRNTIQQKKLTEWQDGISLMEKRINIFFKERNVLEDIIRNETPDLGALYALRHSQMEYIFLFQEDICNHLERVIQLAEDRRSNYYENKKPDSYGGYNVYPNKEKETRIRNEADLLLKESRQLYSRYINFSEIGVRKKKQLQ